MSNNSPVPFLDLVTPHLDLEEELVAVFREAVRTGRFIGGSMVDEFEKEFAAFCEARYSIGVGSGTDALRFALIAAGVKPGDIVITVPNTFIATTEAITQAGAQPDFIDVEKTTFNMDPDGLRDYIDTKCEVDSVSGALMHKGKGRPVTAIVPVHLYGHMVDMDALLEIAHHYHLKVIEDACQAHGAGYYSKKEGCWKKAGSMGTAAAFSFYPGKNLGACGEGGAVTTNDESINQVVRMLRDHGQSRKYIHEMEGYNGRLDAIQAGILRIKLRHLPEWTEKRRKNAAYYTTRLDDVAGVIIPKEREGSTSVYHLYVIHIKDRAGLQQYLNDSGIAAGLHYPVSLHLQAAYKHLEYEAGDFPVAEQSARQLLSLPMFPDLTDEQQDKVVEKISEFLSMA